MSGGACDDGIQFWWLWAVCLCLHGPLHLFMNEAGPHTIPSFALDPKKSSYVHYCTMGEVWIPNKVDGRFGQVWKLICPPVHLVARTVEAMTNAPLDMRAGVARVKGVLLGHEIVA